MPSEPRSAARRGLLAVCALGVCVFGALVVTRAARSVASGDPVLTRLTRSVAAGGPRSDRPSAPAGRTAVTPREDATVTATVTPEAIGSWGRVREAAGIRGQAPEAAVTRGPAPEAAGTQVTPEVARGVSPKVTQAEAGSDPLRDVFIAVKTSGQFHRDRLPPILDTWFTTASNQTWFFSDVDDLELQQRTGGHVINTNCSASHRRDALCCKMAAEYDTFMASGKKWFCHFDDDNYVSTARLAELLSGYSSRQDWYLGKNSIRAPLQIMDRDRPGERVSFWFATGGAGFCLSRALALKMSPIASGGRFMRVGDKIRLPDDVTVGYIVEHVLKVPLSVVDQFHSHLEQMRFIRADQLSQQISFSYSQYPDDPNVVGLDTFGEGRDPTRFYSLHCLFHPSASFCPR